MISTPECGGTTQSRRASVCENRNGRKHQSMDVWYAVLMYGFGKCWMSGAILNWSLTSSLKYWTSGIVLSRFSAVLLYKRFHKWTSTMLWSYSWDLLVVTMMQKNILFTSHLDANWTSSSTVAPSSAVYTRETAYIVIFGNLFGRWNPLCVQCGSIDGEVMPLNCIFRRQFECW